MARPPVFNKMRCAGGSQWTSVGVVSERGKCEVSNCLCKGDYVRVGQTTDWQEAHDWFKRPEFKK